MSMIKNIWLVGIGPRNQENINDYTSQITILGKQFTSDVVFFLSLPFPSPGDLPNPGIEPRSPALQADALTSEPPGKLS